MNLPAMGVERDHDRVVPLVVDITDALQDRNNLIVLAAKPIRGKTFAGKAELCRAVEPADPPAFEEIAPGCFLVERAGHPDLVVADPPGAVRVEGWETDAWCALLDGNEGA